MKDFAPIIAFIFGWLAAQLGKCLITIVRKGRDLKLKDMVRVISKSGGMPSGHTASFIALDTYFGMTLGFNSPLFALAFCTTIIFIYDAVNVRYAVGEQGKVLNSITAADGQKKKTLKVVEGHTIPQVIIGGIIGITIGLICLAVFQ